jgi:glycopeptide antibiotics resistance protein
VRDQAKQLFWLYVILVLTIHLVPVSDYLAPDEFFYISMRPDQVIHFFLFAPFCFLVWLWKRINVYEQPLECLSILFLAIIFSFSLEVLHIVLPYRSFEIGDLVANVIGAVAGWIAFLIRD